MIPDLKDWADPSANDTCLTCHRQGKAMEWAAARTR